MNYNSTPELKKAFEFIEYTGVNIFLTGKAGTGKTTFLHNLKKNSSKRMVVVAPTGVAAINAGGVTIHSFFQLPFGPQLPEGHINSPALRGNSGNSKSILQRFNREKIDIIKSLDLLVIDEVSMVRADLLDGIDGVLRRFKNKNKPFGGVQLLMIGDLQQLAPIVKDDEWEILRNFYDTVFFFSSSALKQTNYISIELKYIFRQSDENFVNLLNKVRNNQLDEEGINTLNSRYIPSFKPDDKEGYITLTTHNNQANSINAAKLNALKTKKETFTATVEGDFPEHAYPTNYNLELKEGAQVMFVKNDPSYEKLFYNGKIGTLVAIDDDILYVDCPGDDSPIEVRPLTWENTKYSIDHITKEIKETVAGKYIQYPLKLAWAITIHKSQGLTFEKAIIDAQAAFAHGQVYVALSRCKSLEGLVLSSPIGSKAIINDKTVLGFNQYVESNPPTSEQLNEAKVSYQRDLLHDLYNFSIISKQMGYAQTIIKENSKSLHPALQEDFSKLVDVFQDKIFNVAEKFKLQIDKIIKDNGDPESYQPLQERVVKAVGYFLPILEDEVLEKIYIINLDIDNKEVFTRINDQLEKITRSLNEKIICLKSCSEGFRVSLYLTSRARASVESFRKKKTSKTSARAAYSKYPAFYNILKQWRDDTAVEQNVSRFRILSQKTLVEIADDLPLSKELLKAVKGMGPKKINQFGKIILEMVYDYRVSIGLPVPEEFSFDDEPKSPNKLKGQNSKLLTFDMFSSGETIEQIAQKRGMATSTIYSHLSHFIGTGDIPLSKLVPMGKAQAIIKHFENSVDNNLSSAKKALGDEYSYEEIRCVLKHILFHDSIQNTN